MEKEFFDKGEQLIKDNYDRAVEGVKKSKKIEKKHKHRKGKNGRSDN